MRQDRGRLPNFFIVGATKSGTTSLYAYLNQHPDIFLSKKIKEPGYWSWQEIRGPITLSDEADYLKLFAGTQSIQCRGDASTFYLFSSHAAERIYQRIPDAKIIISLRNPVDQMYANHKHMVWEGAEELESFEEALVREEKPERALDVVGRGYTNNYLYYREWANLYTQVKRYIDTFGRDQVHVIVFDDLVKDPLRVTQGVFRFLGVTSEFRPQIKVHNQSRGMRNRWLHRLLHAIPSRVQRRIRMLSPAWMLNPVVRLLRWSVIKHEARAPLDSQLRASLALEFRPMIKDLECLIDRDLSAWYAQDGGEAHATE